jgi:peptidoglycan/xylan/chitin deacetylase (PgdA/CDA1 family)
MYGRPLRGLALLLSATACSFLCTGCGDAAPDANAAQPAPLPLADTLPADTTQPTGADGTASAPPTFPYSERPRPEEPGITVYLTFDDGPHPTTVALAQHLRTLGIRSSFFIVGAQCEHPGLQAVLDSVAVDPHFRLYNHSYSHAISGGRSEAYYSDPEGVWADIERNKAVIGTGGRISRLPGKNTWRTEARIRTSRHVDPLVALLDQRGIDERFVGWDVSWGDITNTGPGAVDSLLEKTLKAAAHRTRNGHVVVLCHDYQFRQPAALEQLSHYIAGLKARGNARFAWVEELPGL